MSIESGQTFASLMKDEDLGMESEEFLNNFRRNSNVSMGSVPLYIGSASKRPSVKGFDGGSAELLCGPDLTDVFQSQPDRDSSMRMSFTTFHARRNSNISRGPFNDYERRGSMMSLASLSMNEIQEIEDWKPAQISEELKPNANNKSSNTIKNEKAKQNEDDDFTPIKLEDAQVKRESIIPASSVTVTPVKQPQPQSEENPKTFKNSNSFASSRESYNSSNTNSTVYSDEDTEETIEYISEIGPYDIICGRNNGANNSVGNRRFRVTIMMNLKPYTEAPTREGRTNVIKSVIELMLDTNGVDARFIKKVGDGMYVRLKKKQVREKVGHSFREMMSLAEKEQLDAKLIK